MQTRTMRAARSRRRGNGDEGNHSRRRASPARRRSRGEWENLARKWLASGLTAREFSDGRNEGRTLGIGFQEQVPNHFKLLRSRVGVVSVEGKGVARRRQV